MPLPPSRPPTDLEEPFVVRCLSARFPDGYRTGRHRHPWGQVVFAATGAVAAETGDGFRIVPPGRAVWVPPDCEHELTLWGRARLRTLYLPPARGLPETCAVWSVSPLLGEIIGYIVAAGGLRRESPADRRLARVLLDQIEGLEQAPVDLRMPTDPRALGLARALREDPACSESLELLAMGTGASPRTLERLFEAETGTSLGRWRRQVRLLHALRRLAEGATVEHVAREVGYASASAFIAMFRGVYGTSPGRYFE